MKLKSYKIATIIAVGALMQTIPLSNLWAQNSESDEYDTRLNQSLEALILELEGPQRDGPTRTPASCDNTLRNLGCRSAGANASDPQPAQCAACCDAGELYSNSNPPDPNGFPKVNRTALQNCQACCDWHFQGSSNHNKQEECKRLCDDAKKIEVEVGHSIGF